MDTSSQLKSLSNEAMLFAEVINTSTADNCDLLNACELFSNYLEHQLNEFSQLNSSNTDTLKQTDKLAFQLNKLCQLIKPVPINNHHKKPWKLQLSNYVKEAETLKNIIN